MELENIQPKKANDHAGAQWSAFRKSAFLFLKIVPCHCNDENSRHPLWKKTFCQHAATVENVISLVLWFQIESDSLDSETIFETIWEASCEPPYSNHHARPYWEQKALCSAPQIREGNLPRSKLMILRGRLQRRNEDGQKILVLYIEEWGNFTGNLTAL